MTELLTAAQMRAIEGAAIESGSVTGLDLMERAGQGVVDAVYEEWPELAAGSFRAVVICGPGNNGGDGFVIARLLQNAGWDVEVYLYGHASKLPPDARVNYERWAKMGAVTPFSEQRPDIKDVTLIIDAGFGTGLVRPLDDDLIAAFLQCEPEADLKPENAPPYVVSVDIPTGVSSDTGALMPAAMSPDLTVTFHRAKLGHYLDRGMEFCGKLVVADIGLPQRPHDVGCVRKVVGADSVARKWGSHKFSHGHALVLTGGSGHTGAARLAARGALRIGAGLVTLGVPPAAQMEVASQVTAVMIKRIADATVLGKVLEDVRLNALCLGPAMGLSDEKTALIAAALESRRACVLDADALTLIAQSPALFAALHERCVLTPHAGEFARLFPDIVDKLNAPATTGPAFSKVDATREAAKRAGCTVLFKGPDTVIASPDGRCSVNASVYERSAPWLATAGAGDVLAGFISGLLARGFQPHDAAESAAWLHTECALQFGPGLIAEDLPEMLPDVFRTLGV